MEKQRIGERAASLVTSGMSVVLDVTVTVIVTGGTPRRLRRAGAEVIQVE